MGNSWESFKLKDMVAIVTGASQGIGQALAVGLAEAGVHVALVSRNRASLEQTAAEVEARAVKALVLPTDISNVSNIQTIVGQVNETFGKIDILINNAAWTGTTEALKVTEEEWDQTLDTSLKAIFFLSQAVGGFMIPKRRDKTINIGSTFWQVAFEGRSVYAAAKTGVHHLTRVLAYEWAPSGINVNAIASCITETPTLSSR